jgi:hypothetical protein
VLTTMSGHVEIAEIRRSDSEWAVVLGKAAREVVFRPYGVSWEEQDRVARTLGQEHRSCFAGNRHYFAALVPLKLSGR